MPPKKDERKQISILVDVYDRLDLLRKEEEERVGIRLSWNDYISRLVKKLGEKA